MTISIVIPTFNGEKYIEAAINSALSQTCPADEILVSDDNSTDRTLELCSKYGDKIKIYKNDNGPSGFVNGWNTAISHAECDYVSILHQDDLLSPDFIKEVKSGLSKHPHIKHVFVPCDYIDGYGKVIKETAYRDGRIHIYSGKEYIKAYQTQGSPHIHRCPGVVTHKSVFEKCSYRAEAGHIADDDFFYRVGQYTDIMGVLKPLAFYRLHSGSETGHLSDSILNSRLASDYIFQCRHLSENAILDDDAKSYFYRNAVFHSSKEVILGIINKDYPLFEKGKRDAVILKKELCLSMPMKAKIGILMERFVGLKFTSNIFNYAQVLSNLFSFHNNE